MASEVMNGRSVVVDFAYNLAELPLVNDKVPGSDETKSVSIYELKRVSRAISTVSQPGLDPIVQMFSK